MFKENFAYIILALVAIALIGITIGLQLVILTDQPGTADGTMTDLGLRAGVDNPNNGQATGAQSTTSQQGDQVALNLNDSSEQPEVIVLEPSDDAPTPTEPPPTVAPTSTPLPDDDAEAVVENSPDGTENDNDSQPLVEVASAAQQAVAETSDEATVAEPRPKETVMGATNVTTSDDNSVLAAIVDADPFAISFVPFAFYQDRAEQVKAVGLRSSNGVVVEPTFDSLANGQYPLARPLFIYSTSQAIQERQEVREFVNCYLSSVSEEIEQIGYFQLSSRRFEESVSNFKDRKSVV